MKTDFPLLWLLLGLAAMAPRFAMAAPNPPVASDPFPLEISAPLQQRLESLLAEQGMDDAVRSGRLSVVLVTLDGKRATGLAEVNGHHMMYAASLPKIAILFGAAVAIDRDRLELTDSLRKDMRQMIARSCNPCATRVLEQVGRQWLADLLREEAYRLYDPEFGGGLWVGKDYAPGPAFRRDPLAGLSHGATAWQAARFYWLLLNERLASPEQTRLMIESLTEPRIHHKFVKGLSSLNLNLELWRKSGSWSTYHSDSALVMEEGQPRCIMVVMAQHRNGGRWLEKLAPALYGLAVSVDAGE